MTNITIHIEADGGKAQDPSRPFLSRATVVDTEKESDALVESIDMADDREDAVIKFVESVCSGIDPIRHDANAVEAYLNMLRENASRFASEVDNKSTD